MPPPTDQALCLNPNKNEYTKASNENGLYNTQSSSKFNNIKTS